MKSKYGFVALLDALGTRTSNLERCDEYLRNLKIIEDDITSSLSVRTKRHSIGTKLLDKLSINFFGDTILITCEIDNRDEELVYFETMAFILKLFICKSLTLGLLFRGSLSLGEYIDGHDINKSTVVLGPAISDAAYWYEQLDMVGIVLTPVTTIAIQHLLLVKNGTVVTGECKNGWWADLHKGPTPTKQGVQDLVTLNWPECADLYYKPGQSAEWIYGILRNLQIPWGTEGKYRNTEAYYNKQMIIIDAQKARLAAELKATTEQLKKARARTSETVE